jgi:polysaccharide biosynthesis transport protein
MEEVQEGVIDLKSMFSVLRRQIRLIAFTVIGALALALAYLFQATPMYTANALVFVDPRSKNILEETDRQSLTNFSENSWLESEVIILKSPTVLLATIESASLLVDPEFGPSVGLLDKVKLALGIELSSPTDSSSLLAETMSKLNNAITVRRQGLTYILNVAVTTTSAERSAMLANTLVETYIDLQVKSKIDIALGSRNLLQSQLESARQTLTDSEQMLDRFIQNNIAQISQETGDSNLKVLSERVAALEAQRSSNEARQVGLDLAFAERDWQKLSDTLQSDALRALRAERDSIAERLAQTPVQDELATELTAQLQDIQAQLEQTAQSEISNVRQSISDITNESNEIRRSLRTQVLSAELSAQTLTALFGLQQEAEIAQQQYSTLITRLRDLEAQALVQLADSRLVSPALEPPQPASPNSRLVLALALVLGSGLGLGFAFLNEYYIGGVTSGSQLANILPIPVAAVIPLSQQKRDSHSVADFVIEQPLSAFSESFRKLRASIDQSWRGAQNQCRVIMVSSAVPGEGKTSIALALARTYSQSGKNVLLIDADLRKPSLYKHIATEPKEGLLEYLAGVRTLAASSEFFLRDPLSTTSLVLGGGRPLQATDQLLQSNTFAALIDLARSRVDFVIIDTSPLVPVVDARYIAPFVDAAILVVRFAATTQADVRYAFDQISKSLRPDAAIHSVLSIDEEKAASYRYGGYYNSYTVD